MYVHTYIPKDCSNTCMYTYLLDVLERDMMIFNSSTIKLPAFFMLIIYVRSYFDYSYGIKLH